MKHAVKFFEQLEANNNKEWFEQHKEYYNATIKRPAELFSELIADNISDLTGKTHFGKVYRIYRDVRFSKDKRPYNTHLHMLWSHENSQSTQPAWFFACSPSMLSINMGITSFKGEELLRFRKFVDRHGDVLFDALGDADCRFSDWGDSPLKRVPQPFAADHRQADLLIRRSFLLEHPLDDYAQFHEDIIEAFSHAVKKMLPVWTLLSTKL